MPNYRDMTSRELIGVCAGSNNERAWAEFVRRFQVVIAGTVLRTCRHWGEVTRTQVDDLIQETYLKLCENDSYLLASFRPRQEDSIYGFLEDSIYGFLKVVAANVVHDHFKACNAAKRGCGQRDVSLELFQADAMVWSDPDSDAAGQRLQLDHIDRILRRITVGKDQERKRTIFWLRHQQGLTASEIAAIPWFGLTTEGVESLLLRLTNMIKSHMNGTLPHRQVTVLGRRIRSNR